MLSQSKSTQTKPLTSEQSKYQRYENPTEKKRRKTVLRNKPNIRPIDLGTFDEYGPDMGILWANHQAGGFDNIPADVSQEEFAEAILQWVSRFQSAFIVEDRSDSFKSKRGAVGVIVVSTDLTGDVIRPFGIAFEWATGKNVLRSVCSFLQFVKYSKDVSVCVIYGTNDEEPLFRRQRRYGHRLWHIGKGIWCLAGRKNNPRR